MHQHISLGRIFAAAFLLVAFVIGSVFTLQTVYFFKKFDPSYLIAPFIATLIVSVLLSYLIYFRKKLALKTGLMHAVVELAPELSIIEENGEISFVSHSSLALTGYNPEAFYADAALLSSLIVDEDLAQWNAFREAAPSHEGREALEIRITRADGSHKWLEYFCSPIRNEEGEITAMRSTCLDIDKRKLYEQRIKKLAEFDPLTELPNRRYMQEWIEDMIVHASMYHASFAVLFVDLDRFKHINDTYGHSLGDQLLKQLAQRIGEKRPFEYFISRFGGDEFIIVIPDVQELDEVRSKANTLLEEINEPFVIAGLELNVDASIGIACYPEHGGNVEALIKNADTAMYHVKRNSRERIGFFRHTLFEDSSQFLQIEHRLRQAIKNGEITLFYQPQFNIETMQICGAEALARWFDDLGQIVMSPAEFIPVAEETGLIMPLGKLLLEHMLDELKSLRDEGLPLRLSLNVSATQFSDYAFFDDLLAQTAHRSLDHNLIELEITENILIKETAQQLDLIERIKNEDISLALDDFGTGYSSISYLRNLSSNVLKIDKRFIDTITTSASDRALVGALISLAHSFEIKVVAEGIETAEQLAVLRTLGCDVGQGFYYAKPMNAAALRRFIRENRPQDTASKEI